MFGASTSPLRIDPVLSTVVQQLIQKGFYECRVFVMHEGHKGGEAEAAIPAGRRGAAAGGMGAADFTEMALQLHRDYVALVYEGRERLKGNYEGSFQVILAAGSAKAFTLQARVAPCLLPRLGLTSDRLRIRSPR